MTPALAKRLRLLASIVTVLLLAAAPRPATETAPSSRGRLARTRK